MIVGNKEIDATQYRNDWALCLMSQGMIVKLMVSRWRATASLTSEELGLQFTDEHTRNFMDKYISLGREKLLPPEITRDIASVEKRARENLKSHSFPTVWGLFVPFNAFEIWEQENAKIRQDFFNAAGLLGEKYPTIINIVKEEYKKMAQDVWRRQYPNETSIASPSFVESFVNKIIDKIPSRTDIMASFKYDVTYFIIPMPSMIEDDISQARHIARTREIDDHQAQLAIDTKKKVAQEYLKRKQELIDGFLESTVISMRKHITELCDNVLQSMSRENSTQDISRMQREKVKMMIQKVKMLNFYDDREMMSLLNNLETEIDRLKGERDSNVIVAVLKKIVNTGTEQFTPNNFNPTISTLEI